MFTREQLRGLALDGVLDEQWASTLLTPQARPRLRP